MSAGYVFESHVCIGHCLTPPCYLVLALRAGSVVYLACMRPINRYGQEFRQLLARPADDKTKYKDHETLLSFYTEDVMRAAEREVGLAFGKAPRAETKCRTHVLAHGGFRS